MSFKHHNEKKKKFTFRLHGGEIQQIIQNIFPKRIYSTQKIFSAGCQLIQIFPEILASDWYLQN